jgi:hypothetical protein
MRRSLCFAAVGCMAALAARGGTGVPPRPTSSDYPVHQATATATIAATLVPPDLAKRIFPADVNKNYFVVEVAVYPLNGQTVYIDSFDFGLKFGEDEVSHPRTPEEIASMWAEKNAPQPPSKVNVTAETGVVYSTGSTGNDPVTGRPQHGLSTYNGVAVGSGQPSPPPPPPGDPRVVEAQVRDRALPEGPAVRPVAGYLYFPLISKKSKRAATELQYLKDGVLVSLPFPAR